jgi:hypothetical protein
VLDGAQDLAHGLPDDRQSQGQEQRAVEPRIVFGPARAAKRLEEADVAIGHKGPADEGDTHREQDKAHRLARQRQRRVPGAGEQQQGQAEEAERDAARGGTPPGQAMRHDGRPVGPLRQRYGETDPASDRPIGMEESREGDDRQGEREHGGTMEAP